MFNKTEKENCRTFLSNKLKSRLTLDFFLLKIPIAAQILSCQMSAVNRKVIYPLAKFPSVVWITRDPSSVCEIDHASNKNFLDSSLCLGMGLFRQC